MVVTRSQGEAADPELLRNLEEERLRRMSKEPPASPSVPTGEEKIAAGTSTGARHRSPLSQRTANSTLKLRLAELEAAERLAELKRKELELEATLIKKRLAAQIAEIDDNESLQEEPAPTTAEEHQKVDEWLRTNPSIIRGERHAEKTQDEPRRARFTETRERSPTPGRSRSTMYHLADMMEKLARPRPRFNFELPIFAGAPSEWLPFKAIMRDTTISHNITPVENLQRLRSSLKGDARDAVAALLHTATDPDVIMKTLEQSFGRPELIIDRALDDLKRLPKPGPAATDMNSFAVKLQNIVCVLQSIDRRGYLFSPMLAREVLEKLSPHVKSRWCDYAEEHGGKAEPEIVLLSRFLIREADRALRHTYAPATSTAAAAREPRPAGNKKRGNAVYAVEEVQSDPCPSCNQAHALHQCPTYRALNVEQRNLVREKGLCFKCVDKKHRRYQCKAKLCGVNRCRRPHHASLHDDAPAASADRTARPQPTAVPYTERTTAVPYSERATAVPYSEHATAVPYSERATAVPYSERRTTIPYNERATAVPRRREPSSSQAEAVLSVASYTATGPKTVLLKVCPVVVTGPLGYINTYALLDEGATVTLIDHELARCIGADGPTQPLHLNGVNMSQRERDSKTVTISLRGKKESALYHIKARTVRDLKLHQQSIPTALLNHDHLQDLLHDEVCYDLARPLLLVGTDHWEIIVSRELRIGGPHQPAASRTQLGWVVHGTAPRSTIYMNESVLHVYSLDQRVYDSDQHDRRLHDLVEAHFRLDALGVSLKPRVSDADQRAARIVENTIKKTEEGYEVGLPWRHDHVVMPQNYGAALHRLKGIEKKMDANADFAAEYSAQIANLTNKGYAVPCDGTESQSAVSWYLPHFAVQNPNKPGKRRLVFDAAHRCQGVSLNDQLLEGPDLLLSLQGILFRFRERPVAVTADIQEMFLRVRIRPEDQPAQQFLWRGMDRTNPPRHYKMTSMIFGAASSPFMAHSVRNHNAHAHARTHPRALMAITQSHYMDDLVDSYSDPEQARCTIQELREVHAAAGFTLRGWSASDASVLRDVPSELRSTTPAQLGAGGPENKILGLCWNPVEDELGFNTAMHRVPTEVRAQSRAPTKREALSAVMSIYDPLGLLSHYTIRAKIILQSLWRLQTPWDEAIPAEEAEHFAAWLQQLGEITRLRLRRCYALHGHSQIDLHVLCDASEQAFAAVAYWRAVRYDGSVTLALVAAKAKVAPRRTQSIPRLELQAAVIGARLADAIKKEHRIEVRTTTYWTDSATVVHWVRRDARRYTPFVAHRLGEIAELTHRREWRWLPTEHNVADDATRLSRTPITVSDRWFQGPSFLCEPEETWPALEAFADEQEVLHTGEGNDLLTGERDDARTGERDDLQTGERDARSTRWLPDPTRFSKYETLVRTTARVLAFIDICRHRATRLEFDHIERAEKALIQRAQEESFGVELRKIAAARPISRASRLYKLDPVLEDGLLRVRGRIGASSAPAEMQRPIILDGRHQLTRLIVLREHSAAGHANRERVTNDLRQRYWVIHLRPTVRAVEHSCALCRVRRARPRPPATGDLPRARLDPFHRPFTNCGVDYFGPMLVKVGRRREKRWGALFTCLTTRAVHVELVSSLSVDSALMALRRMAARRGWPRLMYSDNATNFRGAEQELKKAYAEWMPALRDEGLMHRMRWHYIPPGAPNQGGAWERLVRSVKTALQATLRERAPPEEVLRTLLTEAEYSINARPLTHVSVNTRDPEALTPNHFLLGSSTGLPSTGPCDAADRRAWRASQALADHFWQRWLREYLPALVPRGEPASNHRRLQVGDIVVVVDRTLPRNVWPLGTVERTYPGPDGGVRVVDVKTKTGIFRRPACKLAVLVQTEEATQAAPGGELLGTPSRDAGGPRAAANLAM